MMYNAGQTLVHWLEFGMVIWHSYLAWLFSKIRYQDAMFLRKRKYGR